jgi:hypothetical protein
LSDFDRLPRVGRVLLCPTWDKWNNRTLAICFHFSPVVEAAAAAGILLTRARLLALQQFLIFKATKN